MQSSNDVSRVIIAACLCAAITSPGCSRGAANRGVQQAASASLSATVTPDVFEKSASLGQNEEESVTTTDQDVVFQPPFPDRETLFQPPRNAQVARADDSGDLDIKLRGFVRVNGVRAVLEIDGKVGAYIEGDLNHGVKIVQIAPPKVILQRGRSRWTETLFNR